MADPVEQILAEARRKYDLQAARLGDFRKGAATLLAAAGIISGIYAATVAEHHVTGLHVALLVIALASYVMLTVLVIVIHLPRRYDEGEKLGRWLAMVERGDLRADDFTFNMACATDDAYRYNADVAGEIATMFRLVCVLFGLEIISLGLIGWT